LSQVSEFISQDLSPLHVAGDCWLHVATMKNRKRIHELEVERLLIQEPNEGRVRAVLETAPGRSPDGEVDVPTIRLRLLSPTGEPALVAEVDDTGTPTVFVGPPDEGMAVVLRPESIDVWAHGNVVATVHSMPDGGRVELTDAQGNTIVEFP
jgi:hypothetical protein